MKNQTTLEKDFDRIVVDTFAVLQAKFQAEGVTQIENIAVIVDTSEQNTDAPQLPAMTLAYYQGIPLLRRGIGLTAPVCHFPDRIVLFKDRILPFCRTETIEEVIRAILIHELAHFLGFTDEQLQKLEAEWAK